MDEHRTSDLDSDCDVQEESSDEHDVPTSKSYSRNTSTDRATKWGMKIFDRWKKETATVCDLKTITENELAVTLQKFYAEVKQRNGEPYSPVTLVSLRAAIHRFIRSSLHRPFSISTGPAFITANVTFATKWKTSKKYFDDNAKLKQKVVKISAEDMKLLAVYFKNHIISPETLTEYLWFNFCFFFGHMGRDKWRELTVDSFLLSTNDEGHECILSKVTAEQAKKHKRQCEQCEACPGYRIYIYEVIEAFKLYRQKRNEKSDCFFQAPRKMCSIALQTWYRPEPLGKNRLSEMMLKISKNAGLSEMYTNACVRNSPITFLHQSAITNRVTNPRPELSHTPNGDNSQYQNTNMDKIPASRITFGTSSKVRIHTVTRISRK